MLIWIFAFTLLGGLLSVIAASLLLLVPRHRHPDIVPHGVSFALGALLTVALLDLLPEAVEKVAPDRVNAIFATVLAGLMGFFLLEKLLIWRHCHAGDCHAHADGDLQRPAGTLIVLGDSIHNLVDGILIAAAFLVDIQLGVVTSLAVAAHEIPQEVGDFAILLQSGYPPAKAFLFNALSSLAAVVGGVLAYLGLDSMRESLPYFLAVAASSFIYVAVADLIPSLHRKTRGRETVQQTLLIAGGIVLILTTQSLVHDLEVEGNERQPRAVVAPTAASSE